MVYGKHLDWQRGQHHQDFYQRVSKSGYKAAWLRYNTGRAIHHNGEESLQNYYKTILPTKANPVMLIGIVWVVWSFVVNGLGRKTTAHMVKLY